MTQADSKHRRAHKGTDNARAKLRDLDVMLIRALYKHGFQQAMLCVMFGVSHGTMSMIVRNQIWKHLEAGVQIESKIACQIRSLVERIEWLEEARQVLGQDIKDIYKDASAAGLDIQGTELHSLLDTYSAALGHHGAQQDMATPGGLT
jgi:hypothetical protein